MTVERIIQHVFQQPALSQVSEASLGQLVTDYPYFTAARLLLAKKIYDQFPNLHTPAVKKAQLYSNNPHYFYQFVTGELERAAVASPAPVEEHPTAVYTNNTFESTEIVDTAPPAPEETIIERELPVNAWAYEPEETVTEKTEMDVPADEIAAASTETVTETAPPVYEWANEPVATTLTGETSGEIDNEMVENTIPAEPEPEITAAASEPVMEEVAPDAGRIATADEEEPIKIFPLEIPEEETTLTFQPLYTDDYFAYKRLKEPERAEDLNEKGMAEMKSFTEWLREMKDDFAQKASKDWYHQQLHRIYEDEDPEVSETVEKMAMESITLNDDIVSETLAEIWARQHQYQTAIQIYQKLSLLNPNKSTYFAQKIQELRVQSQTDKN